MGLDITTTDDVKSFHIGYIGFSTMRAFFILHYSKKLYNNYNCIMRATVNLSNEYDELYDKLLEEIGDLSILVNHSDCDGELTSNECKKLKKCLVVDEDKINELSDLNNEYRDRRIELMYEFIDIVDYCAKHDNVKLIFG